jgi:hypothetical protein
VDGESSPECASPEARRLPIQNADATRSNEGIAWAVPVCTPILGSKTKYVLVRNGRGVERPCASYSTNRYRMDKRIYRIGRRETTPFSNQDETHWGSSGRIDEQRDFYIQENNTKVTTHGKHVVGLGIWRLAFAARRVTVPTWTRMGWERGLPGMEQETTWDDRFAGWPGGQHSTAPHRTDSAQAARG